MSYETGYVGKPGSFRATKVHLFFRGEDRAVCGYRPSPSWTFQWCARGIKYDYLECDRCKVIAKRLILKETRFPGNSPWCGPHHNHPAVAKGRK